ncbi:MAG: GldG family protein, partial [Oscillospiraceae bacterium]|nr:GldG family protein [Oscillospiraceae bacterium]
MKIANGKKMSAIFTLIIVLLIVAVFLLNAVALVLSNRYSLAIDLTANAVYEIGDETKAMLDALCEDVTIDVLASEKAFAGDSYLVQAKYILDRYPQYSQRVSLRYIDYTADPSYAASHPDLTLTEGDIIVSAKDNVKQITLKSLFNYAYTASGSLTVESSRAEEAVTGAIMSVMSDDSVRVGVISGHGEQSMDNFTALLVNNNFVLETAVLATDDLSGFDALVLLAPQTDLSEDDVRTLEAYLYNGGEYGRTLLYTASISQTQLPNIETLLSEWGVSVGSGIIFETKAERTYQYQPFYPIADHSSAAYQDKLIDSSAPMLMPMSRPLEVLFDSRDGQYTETLLSFGASAGVRPIDAGDDFSADDAEKWGPIPAMVLASRRVYENGQLAKRSSIIVSGSTSMLEELCIQNSSLANSPYMVNLMGDLTEKEEGVVIAPKSLAGKTLGITTA